MKLSLSYWPAGKIRFSLFKKTSNSIRLNRGILEQAQKVCRLYDSCFRSLKDEVKMDVLIGLGCNGALVSKMWYFLWLTLGLDVDKIVRAAAAAKGGGATDQDPVFSVLTLCCQTTQYRLVWVNIMDYSGLPLIRPPLGPVKVSWLQEWPHFRGEFALRSILWDILKWPHYRGGLISGVQIRGYFWHSTWLHFVRYFPSKWGSTDVWVYSKLSQKDPLKEVNLCSKDN